jgi:hypothetical protein
MIPKRVTSNALERTRGWTRTQRRPPPAETAKVEERERGNEQRWEASEPAAIGEVRRPQYYLEGPTARCQADLWETG